MVSNLSTIGLAFGSDAEFSSTMTALAEGPARSANGSRYAVWRSTTGAELWFHVTSDGSQVVGLTPFFNGKSAVAVEIRELIRRPGETEFEGAAVGWVAPDPNFVGAYPIVFDVPDFLALSNRSLPLTTSARIVAFAHQLKAFPSPDAFSSMIGEDLSIAPYAFFPVGTFAGAVTATDPSPPPSSTAVLTGRVLTHSRLTNEVTGQDFHYLLVESLEATYDVVADPEAVEGEIIQNGVVEVSGALFGRLL